VRYGAIEATVDRSQGSNVWLTFAIREGKNREVKNVLGHLGLAVNRLIRVSFGPFRLGDLPEGAIEEVKTRTLRDQLGDRIAALAGADFSGPRIEREADAVSAPHRHPATGAQGDPRRRVGRSAPASPDARVHPAPLDAGERKRPPRTRKKRQRDAERFGQPELARREKKARGRRSPPVKRR
jgi:23S rRNA pseudouridine2605 synthase